MASVMLFLQTCIINLLIIFSMALAALAVRIYLVHPHLSPRPRQQRHRGDSVHLLIVLGSGGHTTEMFIMCREMEYATYTFRTYVVNEGDTMSESNARRHEEVYMSLMVNDVCGIQGGYNIMTVPRARNIHQSLWTTTLSALACLKACLAILRGHQKPIYSRRTDTQHLAITYPDMIVSNGPATGAIMIFAAFLLRLFDLIGSTNGKLQTVYVESWARVKTLSLSGKLLTATGICDLFLSQWPSMNAANLVMGVEPVYRGSFVG